MHRKGIELGTRPGTEVVAVAPGEVAFCGELPGFDEVVVLDHGGGYLSLTGRLFTSGVAVGDEIATGQVLGRVAPKAVDDGMGTTVYFELRHAERPIDPRPWFPGGRAPKAPGLALVAEEEGEEDEVDEMVAFEEAAAVEATEASE